MSPKVATSLHLDETWQDCSGKVTTSAKVVHLPEDFFLLALGLPKVNSLRKNDQKSPGEKCWPLLLWAYLEWTTVQRGLLFQNHMQGYWRDYKLLRIGLWSQEFQNFWKFQVLPPSCTFNRINFGIFPKNSYIFEN